MGSRKKIAKLQAEIDNMHKITLDVVGLMSKQTEVITNLRETSTTLTTRIDVIEKQIPTLPAGNVRDLMYQ